MLDTLIQWLLGVVGALDYFGVFFLMVIESSFVPFPSELVIPPAAYLAAQGEMNIWMVIFLGTFGSLVGAWINYFLALYLGKPLVYKLVSTKWARLFLLSKKKVEKAEEYFLKNGAISTFVGRLLPGIRQLVSLPAGFVKMNLAKFSFYTTLGAGIWIAALAALGYFLGQDYQLQTFYYIKFGLVAVGLMVLGVFVYVVRKRRG